MSLFLVLSVVIQYVLELEDLSKCAGTPEELVDTHLARFQYTTDEYGIKSLGSTYVKHGHMLKRPANRENVSIDFVGFTNLNDTSLKKAANAKKEMADNLIETLQTRFSSFGDSVFENLRWIDPKNWLDDREYGRDQIQGFADHFKVPLGVTNYDPSKVLHEWKRFRIFVTANHKIDLLQGKTGAKKILKQVLNYRRSEFPNLCLLFEYLLIKFIR